MGLNKYECCILNQGHGAWAFETLATQLSQAIGIDITTHPRRFNYVLSLNGDALHPECDSFIPLKSIQIAADKRALAAAFQNHSVPIPETHLLESFADVSTFLTEQAHREWCLKYPTSCGANGHRLVTTTDPEPSNWPRPFVVQEFIRMDRPEVFRIYCVGGDYFGWMARRFPDGVKPSPWVAHARGARYVNHGEPPREAVSAARLALTATDLLASFGCADLLCRPNGEWLVLEVGTDGLFNHVDRDLNDAALIQRLHQRIAKAFVVASERQ